MYSQKGCNGDHYFVSSFRRGESFTDRRKKWNERRKCSCRHPMTRILASPECRSLSTLCTPFRTAGGQRYVVSIIPKVAMVCFDM